MPSFHTHVKNTIRELVYHCPLGAHKQGCPFSTLALLSHGSREDLLDSLSEDHCVRLFDLIDTCKCPADPRSTDQVDAQ